MGTLYNSENEVEVELLDPETIELETIEPPELEPENVEDLSRAVDSYETVEDYITEIWGG